MVALGAMLGATGVPAFLLTPVQPMFVIQTPRQVTIIAQHDSNVRRIYLDVPHSESHKSSWYGESVGHYEGVTLNAMLSLASPLLAQERVPAMLREVSPWSMFLSADVLFEAVMISLMFASVVTWTIFLAKWARLKLTQWQLNAASLGFQQRGRSRKRNSRRGASTT